MTKQQRDDLNFLHGQINALMFVIERPHWDLIESIESTFVRLKNELIEQD